MGEVIMKDDTAEMRLERVVRAAYADPQMAKALNEFFGAISGIGMPEKTFVTVHGRFYVENGKPGTFDNAQRKESQAFQVLVATVKEYLKTSGDREFELLKMLVDGM